MIFRIEKTHDYTVMSNYHLKDINLSLKGKGLLSLMLSLPDNWDYSIKGLAKICKDGETAIRHTIEELESMGYLNRNKIRDEYGQISDWEYVVREVPKTLENTEHSPLVENPQVDSTLVENQTQINTNKQNTKKEKNTISKDIVQSDQPKPKKLSLYDKCVNLINEYTDDEKLRNALIDYLKFKLSAGGGGMTYANQFKGVLNKLDTLDGDKVEIVNCSLACGWKNVYPLDNNRGYRSNNKRKFGEDNNISSEKVTEEELANGYLTNEKF